MQNRINMGNFLKSLCCCEAEVNNDEKDKRSLIRTTHTQSTNPEQKIYNGASVTRPIRFITVKKSGRHIAGLVNIENIRNGMIIDMPHYKGGEVKCKVVHIHRRYSNPKHLCYDLGITITGSDANGYTHTWRVSDYCNNTTYYHSF